MSNSPILHYLDANFLTGDEGLYLNSSARSLSQFSPSNMADISVVSGDICTKLGEGPTWDAATQKLFFVDALAYSVHVLDVETGKVLRETKKVAAKFTSEEVIVVRLTA